MSKQIGSFSLGGTQWSIELDNEFCKETDSTFCTSSGFKRIKLCDIYRGEKLTYNTIEKFLWEAILYEVVVRTMEYRKLNLSDVIVPYASFVYQAINTLTSHPDEWDGSVTLGGRDWIIRVDNVRAFNEGWYGLCLQPEGIIVLATETEGEPYTDEFIYQTLWHEIAHAIAYELGRSKEKINSEKFVNTISIFIYEVISTLKIKYPDESD